MQKTTWKKVLIKRTSMKQPTARWGHSSSVINHQLIIFGGYADSNYMNDLWSYNTVDMEWRQIQTKGETPCKRSNCSMHYDINSNKLILFGGGGPNKQRFNTINILDWSTKQWMQISPKQNQEAPWERTYHSSQLRYPYLIVYGGEGVADLDDLWIFNFITMSWKEVTFPKQAERPCARRFHSSVLLNQKFYVIGGCYDRYRSLNDIYFIDLSTLFRTGSLKGLHWKELKLKDQSLLSRWGHTSHHYDGKIYVFAGRFSNDLNDIIIIDESRQSIKCLNVIHNVPKPRRRHSGCLFGSCLLVFGGFNGEYFNDLNYINFFEGIPKFEVIRQVEDVGKYINDSFLSDRSLNSVDQQLIYVNKGLIVDKFVSWQKMQQFLIYIDDSYSKQTLLLILKYLYTGEGTLPEDIAQKFKLKSLSQSSMIKLSNNIQNCKQNPSLFNNCFGQWSQKVSFGGSFVQLTDNQFKQFIQHNRNPIFFDNILNINQNYQININSIKLIISNHYFQYLLSGFYLESIIRSQQVIIPFQIPIQNIIIFEILIYYLTNKKLVVPVTMKIINWSELIQLANYYCVKPLITLCQQHLCTKITIDNTLSLIQLSLKQDLNILLQCCVYFYIKKLLKRGLISLYEIIDRFKYEIRIVYKIEKGIKTIEKVYNLIKFDIAQKSLNCTSQYEIKKKDSESTQGDKENYQYNL